MFAAYGGQATLPQPGLPMGSAPPFHQGVPNPTVDVTRPQDPQIREPEGLTLSGEVRIGRELADSGTVVLHRVSALESRGIDSVSVDRGGTFEIRMPAAANSEGTDVFFASVRYENVLYFGEVFVGSQAPEADAYVIQAYPSSVVGLAGVPVLRVRNLFLERATPEPGWMATDLFELQNGTGFTLVAGEGGASWSQTLPLGAVDFRAGQSDLPPDAASFRGGRVHASAPIPPGESVYLIRYRVPEDSIVIPVESPAGSMELLIREPIGDLSVTGLAPVEAVELAENTYRRFAGRDLAPTVVTVAVGTSISPTEAIPLLAAILALVLTAAGALLTARTQRDVAPVPGARQQLLIEVARLDEAWSEGRVEAEEYRRRRRRLLARIGV